MKLGLSFFSAAGDGTSPAAYGLLLDAARFADEHGLASVWLPERHFHPFGGLYPNPAVLGAAVAVITRRVSIRAGSVVMPLQHPARVAEEWAAVDNLSGGRVEVSFASGWQRNDFVLAPDHFAQRKEVMTAHLDVVRRLWRGEAVDFPLDDGSPQPTRTFPRPIQPELPVWITSAGSPTTAVQAGHLGAGLLTHLVGQTYDELASLIANYRKAHHAATGEPGRVALMLHSLLGADHDATVDAAMPALKTYLRSATSLRTGAAGSELPSDLLTDADLDYMLTRAAHRYIDSGALVGGVDAALASIQRAADAGVDEVSCLIDFVDDPPLVRAGLDQLAELQRHL